MYRKYTLHAYPRSKSAMDDAAGTSVKQQDENKRRARSTTPSTLSCSGPRHNNLTAQSAEVEPCTEANPLLKLLHRVPTEKKTSCVSTSKFPQQQEVDPTKKPQNDEVSLSPPSAEENPTLPRLTTSPAPLLTTCETPPSDSQHQKQGTRKKLAEHIAAGRDLNPLKGEASNSVVPHETVKSDEACVEEANVLVGKVSAILFEPLLSVSPDDDTACGCTPITTAVDKGQHLKRSLDRCALRFHHLGQLLQEVQCHTAEHQLGKGQTTSYLYIAIDLCEKFHRFGTTSVETLQQQLFTTEHSSDSNSKALHVVSSKPTFIVDSPSRSPANMELPPLNIPLKVSSHQLTAEQQPSLKPHLDHLQARLEKLDAHNLTQESQIKSLQREKAKMTKQIKRLMQTVRNLPQMDADGGQHHTKWLDGGHSSLDEEPSSHTFLGDSGSLTIASMDFGGTSDEDTVVATSDNQSRSLFAIHDVQSSGLSLSANWQRGGGGTSSGCCSPVNSVRSVGSQIKINKFNDMERTRRKEVLSEKKWPYKLGNVIGRGAHGVVYLALMEDTGETVAAKQMVFDKKDASWEKNLQTLQTEISVLRKVEHENIVSYLFTDRSTDKHGSPAMMIFMEYVSGGSISGLVKQFGTLEEKTAAIFAAQILLGLQHLHEHGISHRDVKPANCLLSPTGVVKLADFGTALLDGVPHQPAAGSPIHHRGKHHTHSTSNESSPRNNTYRNDMIGTPLYMAPESVRGEDTDWRADIWSVGCTLMELLTGAQPWSHLGIKNPLAVLHRVASNDEALPLPSSLSPSCRDFLSQCLVKKPLERPSCDELLRHAWFESFDILELTVDTPAAAEGLLNGHAKELHVRREMIDHLASSISQYPMARKADI